MKAFKINFGSRWLIGVAIVFAEDATAAAEKFREKTGYIQYSTLSEPEELPQDGITLIVYPTE